MVPMQAHFDGVVSAAGSHIRAARVARKRGPDGKPLSAGYGFVECSSEDVAKLALAQLQARAPHSCTIPARSLLHAITQGSSA